MENRERGEVKSATPPTAKRIDFHDEEIIVTFFFLTSNSLAISNVVDPVRGCGHFVKTGRSSMPDASPQIDLQGCLTQQFCLMTLFWEVNLGSITD